MPAPHTINGVAIDWDAVPPQPTLKCPHCGETKMIEVAGREGYCNVCGKSFTLSKT